MMTYGDVIVAIIYAMQMMICSLFALPYKRTKKHIPLLVLITFVEYYVLKIVSLSSTWYWFTYVEEFLGTLLVLAIFNSGNIWRNFMISWFNFQVANILISIECVIASYFINIDSIIIFGASGKDPYVFVEILLMFANAMVGLFLSKKFFKSEFNGDGMVYKYIVAIIAIAGTIMGLNKSKQIVDARYGVKDSIDVFTIYAVIIISFVVIMYLVGYFYNASERKRLLREKKELKQIIENNYIQYEKIVDSNKKLESFKEKLKQGGHISDDNLSTLSLSGNMALDSLIATYDVQTRKNNIAFEVCVAPLTNDIERDMKLVTIIDNLMELALKVCRDAKDDKWIFLGIRQDTNNLIIKHEFSKQENYQLNIKGIKLISKIVSSSSGAMSIDNKETEARINILLP